LDISQINSGPNIILSVDSHQQFGDLHGLPYNALYGAMPIDAWQLLL